MPHFDVSQKRMKIEDADQLERQFNISFPERYKEAITIAYPFEELALELESSANGT
jgi:hypothetical protein